MAQRLNLSGVIFHWLNTARPVGQVQIILLVLSTALYHIDFIAESKTTITVVFNEGWQIAFRIDNASSRIEPSLKFDINLVSAPNGMFKHTLTLK